MHSTIYDKLLNSDTIVQYLDNEQHFAYVALSNLAEQKNLHLNSGIAKVLVFDTRTHYFNASILVRQFREDQDVDLASLMKMKITKDIMERIEVKINNDPEIKDNKQLMKLPTYNNKQKYHKANYRINSSNKTFAYTGTYLHPDMLGFIIAWCNITMMNMISELVMSTLILEGTDETVNFETITNKCIDQLTESAEHRKQLIHRINAQIDHDASVMGLSELATDSTDSNDDSDTDVKFKRKTQVDHVKQQQTKIVRQQDQADELLKTSTTFQELINSDETFDYLQYQKLMRYIIDVKQNSKYSADENTTLNQAIAVIANYDDKEFIYKSGSYKLTVALVNELDIDKYISKYVQTKRPTEEELEAELCEGKFSIKYEVILKIPSLRGVPDNFLQNYVSIYDSDIDLDIKRVKAKTYLYTTEIDEFKESFMKYIEDWMLF